MVPGRTALQSPLISHLCKNEMGHGARVTAQTSIDEKLQAEFEESSSSFHYSILIWVASVSYEEQRPHLSDATLAYLHQIQKAKAINRLQSLPSGSIQKLYDTMVQKVFELTGYDRVMVYKFHDDDGAEVFAIHVNKEPKLENQKLEKNILQTQTLLFDMLLRDAPLGLTRDSLHDAVFPGALSLGEVVCGIAVVKITDKSYSSLVVKRWSLPWKDYEMDAIYSLQLILRNAFKEAEAKDSDTKEIHMKFNDLKIDGIQELKAVISEIVRLIETAFVPILVVDAGGLVNGYLDLEMVEFELHDVLITSISQVMMKSISKLQQVLVTLLLVSVNAILSGGQLGLATTLTKDSLGETVQLGHLEFRITHSGGRIAQ
ncbi:UNVERIFIED_CONTAM: Phytochrome A [Sesamum calycinum]|uniref:Phytochrome A n=1 Tax=Sesamum calycinum TaxID=2727403 RepID=A0AAW2IT12_9LAMI